MKWHYKKDGIYPKIQDRKRVYLIIGIESNIHKSIVEYRIRNATFCKNKPFTVDAYFAHDIICDWVAWAEIERPKHLNIKN